MCMINRNEYLPSSLDYVNKVSQYSMVQKQYKHIFNESLHITVMNVFQIRILWAAAEHQGVYYTGKLAIVLPEYAMNTAVFNQLIMQLLF